MITMSLQVYHIPYGVMNEATYTIVITTSREFLTLRPLIVYKRMGSQVIMGRYQQNNLLPLTDIANVMCIVSGQVTGMAQVRVLVFKMDLLNIGNTQVTCSYTCMYA